MVDVLVYSRDPGGTNALIALVECLDAGRLELSALAPFRGPRTIAAKSPGLGQWIQAGFEVRPWSEDLMDARLAVLTATTDVDDDTDTRLWRAARQHGLPSAAVVDNHINMDVRVTDLAGRRCLPDLFLCTDSDQAARVAASLDIPPGRCLEIGQLHLERVQRLARRSAPRVQAQRALWGVQPGERVALFCSECGEEMRQAGRNVPYDERAALERVLAGLPSLGALQLLVIRPHPRDLPGKYDCYASDDCHASAMAPFRVLIDSASSSDLALLAADVVVGIKSSMLIEARAIGRPVVSLLEINSDD